MLSVRTPIRKAPPPKPTPAARVVDTRPTVLISEQEVKLLTAAALTPIAAPHPSLLSRLIARAKAAIATVPVDDGADRPRYVQKHYSYLESAAMARAMERL